MSVTIHPQSAPVNRLVLDVAEHVGRGGSEADLRALLAAALNAAADHGYKTGMADGDDFECDLPHVTFDAAAATVRVTERAREALERLHEAVHDTLPARSCLTPECRAIDTAVAIREAAHV